jgi:hypothetical protein
MKYHAMKWEHQQPPTSPEAILGRDKWNEDAQKTIESKSIQNALAVDKTELEGGEEEKWAVELAVYKKEEEGWEEMSDYAREQREQKGIRLGGINRGSGGNRRVHPLIRQWWWWTH